MTAKQEKIDRSEIENYLNQAIMHWYKIYRTTQEYEVQSDAKIYIDAFQSMRETFLGQKIPLN